MAVFMLRYRLWLHTWQRSRASVKWHRIKNTARPINNKFFCIHLCKNIVWASSPVLIMRPTLRHMWWLCLREPSIPPDDSTKILIYPEKPRTARESGQCTLRLMVSHHKHTHLHVAVSSTPSASAGTRPRVCTKTRRRALRWLQACAASPPSVH